MWCFLDNVRIISFCFLPIAVKDFLKKFLDWLQLNVLVNSFKDNTKYTIAQREAMKPNDLESCPIT